MGKKNISQEKIIQSFISCAFEKSAGATSLADIADSLEIKKASLYNHFENREAMYNASIEYCGHEIKSVNFLPIQQLQVIKNNQITLFDLFKQLIERFFDLYENEPLFEMYSFIHAEKYFNVDALNIVREENKIITDDIKASLTAFITVEQIGKKTEEELENISNLLSSIIIQQRDNYVATKKEVVRQNPDSGAGSLFALPVNEKDLNKTIKIVENYLKLL